MAQKSACRAISFNDSEVTQKIKLTVIDTSDDTQVSPIIWRSIYRSARGLTKNNQIHEISAHELANFFVKEFKKPLEMMSSRIVPYHGATKTKDERFVMIFAQDEKTKTHPVNRVATKLYSKAVKPVNINTPYQGWGFGSFDIPFKDLVVERIRGPVLIVRETKIDGRWQMVADSYKIR